MPRLSIISRDFFHKYTEMCFAIMTKQNPTGITSLRLQ